MEIDKARNRVIDMFCSLRNEYVDHLTYGGKCNVETEADIHALDEIITVLNWYIEHDLIKRDDAKKVFSDYLKGHECLDDDRANFVAEKKCEQILKAEYRGESNED